jgi:phage gpG-like protein
MAKQNKFNFKGIEKKARTTLENAMVEIGNAAKSFFVENFRKQGFDDKNVERWQPRKKADKRAGRAILVKTGDLRRSIIRNPANRAALSVKISTDLVYAARHNNGLKGMPKRQFMGDSYNLNERIKKIIVKRLDKTFKKCN